MPRFSRSGNEHGRAHFRLEEDVLLPAYAGHGDPHHPLVARVLCDHVAIRHRADALALERASTVTALHELGVRLAQHVRVEERELFPLIESAMPAADLAAVAEALELAEREAVDSAHPRERDEASDDRAVDDVDADRDQWRRAAVEILGESRFGRQGQSIEPSRATRAAVRPSPIAA